MYFLYFLIFSCKKEMQLRNVFSFLFVLWCGDGGECMWGFSVPCPSLVCGPPGWFFDVMCCVSFGADGTGNNLYGKVPGLLKWKTWGSVWVLVVHMKLRKWKWWWLDNWGKNTCKPHGGLLLICKGNHQNDRSFGFPWCHNFSVASPSKRVMTKCENMENK